MHYFLSRRYLFAVILFSFSTVVSLLLVEAGLQIMMPSEYYIWPPHMKAVFKPDPSIMPGISGDSRFEINSDGIRGDELTSAHTYRILALGGSTTECLYLDQSEAWPSLLQAMLNERATAHNVWVGNGGMSGTTTRHHLTALRYIPFDAMKIDAIVLLVGANDFLKRLSQDALYDPMWNQRPDAEDILLRETFLEGRHLRSDLPFFRLTAIWQLLKKARNMLINETLGKDEAGEMYLKWEAHRRNAVDIRYELPDLTTALAEYESNVVNIIETAQRKSLRVIFMTQPTIWRPDMPRELVMLLWTGGIGNYQNEPGKPYYSIEALEKGMHLFNHTLLKICRERAVECLDLASILEKTNNVFYDDLHFNESGSLQISRILAQYLLGREPLRSAGLTN